MNHTNLPRKWLIGLIAAVFTFAYIPFENFLVYAKGNEEHQAAKNQENKKNKVRKEVENLRTENSKTFLNEDGTYTAEIAQSPIHYKDAKGKWKEIDNTLVDVQDKAAVENKSNKFKVKIEKEIKGERSISITDQDKSINLGLESIQEQNGTKVMPVQETKGEVKENSITYPEILDGVNLKYSIGSDRVKEDIIYKEKPEDGFPEKFTYKMDLEGLEVKKEGEIIYLLDSQTKEKLYYIEAPYMYDSYIPKGYKSNKGITSIPEEAISYNITLDYEVQNGQLYLYMIPDQEWLNDKNRVYPITIDPTIVRITSSNLVDDTNLRSGAPTQTGGNDLELGTGLYKDSTHQNVIRSLLKFNVSSIPQNVIITNADLNLWMSSVSNDTPIDIGAYQMTKAWEENQASWNYSKTSPYTSWSAKGGDYVATPIDTVGGIGSLLDLSINLKWSIPVSLVNRWLANPASNYGILMKSKSESLNTYKKFISSEHSIGTEYQPLLVVTYKTGARLGIEDYWSYDTHPLVGGASYTNLTTSNNVIQYEDFSVLGRADSGFTFTRTYNSKDLEKSALGYGWTFTGNEKLFVSSDGIQYYDEDGTTHEFTYDAKSLTYREGAGNYETIKDTAQNTYTLYNLDGTSTTFKIMKVDYDTDVNIAYIQSKEDRNGNKINYTYNSSNQLVKIATDLGNSLSKAVDIQYNSKGQISKISYDGKEFSYRYNAAGYLEYVDQLRYVTGEKTTTQFIYKNNRIATIIDPNGRKTDYTYENENLVKVQEPHEVNGVKDPADRPGTNYTLDQAAKIATVTDAEDNTTVYHVNDNYVVTKVTDPSGKVTEYKLDNNYNVLTENETEEGASKTVQTNTYDPNGNLLTTKDAEGNTQTYTYTNFNLVSTHTDSTSKTSTYHYDSKGNLKESIVPNNNSEFLTTTYSYNSYGDLLSMSSSDGMKEEYNIDYSSAIKTITHTDPHGNRTKTKTDLSGNVLSYEDGKGKSTSYRYNLKNELEKVIDAKNSQTNYQYDKNGNLLSITNALGAITSYQYNGQNLIESETNALGKITNYLYDANGSIKQVTKPNGHIIQYNKDEETGSETVVANGKTKWRYVKDGEDQLIYDENNSLAKRITYYENGLVKSIDQGDSGRMTSFEYKGDEYLSSINFPAYSGQNQVTFEPNDAYNTKEIKLNDQNLASFEYNKSGLLQSILFNKGSRISKEYTNGRLASETLSLSASQVFNSYQYNYDSNNSITSILSNEGTTKYEYDDLNQLTKETLPDGTQMDYGYDTVGNRVSKKITKDGVTKEVSSQYNEANQLVQVGDKKYVYDANGNLQSDGNRTYEYNEFDQLVKIKDSAGKVLAEYSYDEEGRRVSSNDSHGKTFYTYNGNQVLYEEDENKNVIKGYTYDDDGHPLTMFYKGITYYYLTNYRGDVLAMTDESGKIVASYTYDAWGNILTQSGEMAEINPYRYAGYRYDDDTKLYYLMARYYNPENGVFLSLDPVRGDLLEPQTLNGYNYAHNNPVMFIDPDGTKAKYIKIKRKIVAIAIDLALIFIPGIVAIKSAIKLGKLRNVSSFKLRQVTDEAIKRIPYQIIGATITMIVNGILTVLGKSFGEIIANVLDSLDKKYDGYITVRYK
ncbi:DNRLRE domain-containing protein [Robertmurraya andreesenii]|uniref:RHS repeat-associated protein n=1 Tax=Anoxybacillus andreesenii TaxID=1325932 RepID=A0ABT9V693_9BACL|nr:DNRLRE domain-containing protein [Robertmurraya andreesenii]MDQ0156471.1 RHS repeat-associated protein [Robertmurraya andreesenii]